MLEREEERDSTDYRAISAIVSTLRAVSHPNSLPRLCNKIELRCGSMRDIFKMPEGLDFFLVFSNI